MKEIQLTQNQIAIIDDEDYERISKFKWFAHKKKSNNTFYARRSESCISPSGKKSYKTILMHNEILNPPIGKEIDHKDHNGLNNCKSNLRICNRSENMVNKILKNKTGYRGLAKVRGGYQVYIRINNKGKYVGFYSNPIDAAKAYDIEAKKIYGEFAITNFQNEQP